MVTERLVISVEEAAHALSCSRGLAYRMVREGTLPHMRIGRKVVVPVRSIERMIEAAEARADAVREASKVEARYP